MKKISPILISSMILFACNSNPNGYTLKGKIANINDGFAIWIDMETGNSDTTRIKNGNFEFSGTLKEPTFVAMQFYPEGKEPALVGIVAENKPMSFQADWKKVSNLYGKRYLQGFELSGSRNNDVWQEINNVSSELLKEPRFVKLAKIKAQIAELYDKDKEACDSLRKESANLNDALNKAIQEKQKALIIANNDVEIVTKVLWSYVYKLPIEELDSLFNCLTSGVQNTMLGTELKNEINNRKKMSLGMPAFDFTLKDLEGNAIKLSSLRGRYILLDFWASWCAPCRASFPEIKELYAKYKDNGLDILGISHDRDVEAWKNAVAQEQLSWQQVIDEYVESDRTFRVGKLYGVSGIPVLILIDPQGNFVGRIEKKDLKTKLAEIFG